MRKGKWRWGTEVDYPPKWWARNRKRVGIVLLVVVALAIGLGAEWLRVQLVDWMGW